MIYMQDSLWKRGGYGLMENRMNEPGPIQEIGNYREWCEDAQSPCASYIEKSWNPLVRIPAFDLVKMRVWSARGGWKPPFHSLCRLGGGWKQPFHCYAVSGIL